MTIISDKDPFEASINFINCAFEVSDDDTTMDAAVAAVICCFSSNFVALLLLSVADGEDGNGVSGNCGGDSCFVKSDICVKVVINELSRSFAGANASGGVGGAIILVDISSFIFIVICFDAI